MTDSKLNTDASYWKAVGQFQCIKPSLIERVYFLKHQCFNYTSSMWQLQSPIRVIFGGVLCSLLIKKQLYSPSAFAFPYKLCAPSPILLYSKNKEKK